jgi:cyclohexyl-isocyanide hydratase
MADLPLKVLLLAFPGMNTLDLNGPVEVFGSSSVAKQGYFSITIAAAEEITEAFEGVLIKRHVSFAELLGESSGNHISKYDILVLPGGPQDLVQKAIDSKASLEVIQAFTNVKATTGRTRWLVSICTGAGFLGTLGLLAGKTVTAHWRYLDILRDKCETAAKERGLPPTTVVRKRWVDAGELEGGIRLITAGGVSCGIDCILWVVSELFDMEVAGTIAMAMDYDWKYGNIAVTKGEIVGSPRVSRE